MIEQKAYSRLTLSLDIAGKLESGPFKGYHELKTIKQKINLFDIVGVEESSDMAIVSNSPGLPADNTNLCWKAASAVKQKYGIDKNVKIKLKKNIPLKGGLAGGSSDAAAVINILDSLWRLNMSLEEKSSLGRSVGMDVPFFFSGNTAFDTEAGGTVEPCETGLELYYVLYLPDFGVSTAEAYKSIDYSLTGRNSDRTDLMFKAFKADSMKDVVSNAHNDFEYSLFSSYPEFEMIRTKMMKAGCNKAIVSGSGSTVIGFTESRERAQSICGRLKDRTLLVSTLTSETG